MNLCIIPARGGSKRIPRKNIKDFCGLPLIAYSIKNAQISGVFDKIIVSTDDERIAKIAENFGAIVPFIRPKNLSDDYSDTSSVINHAVEFLEKKGEFYDFVCTIYATAPLLSPNFIKLGLENLKNSDAKYAFSVTSMPFPIWRTFRIKNDRCEMFFPENFAKRSQDLEEAYQDAGQFYWQSQKCEKTGIFFSQISIPIVLPRFQVCDIDTLEDWQMAEIMYKNLIEMKILQKL